ncbi:Ku protein [Xaviernesmea oryzae]|uniref:Non-homologous end joining protein Ku n=1 Tax=Xaviernesmea oryzae TaxID=464029 RepID=A0A1Q9AUH4_9HYPH|nr:Ku protein [Xaviernesmea oryzae]OLP59106.1 Ku protein [Xaviernesmea oryzae]SEK86390.1 DNA end-binding protein Ku [Xaviernesmea oryzae]
MAARNSWKGYLKLSLVTCPVAMSPATSEAEKVRFRTLNRKTGHPIVSHYVDAVTGKAVADDDVVKGYPKGEDAYVMLEDEEIEAVALDSTRTIDIDMFVPAESISWVYLDTPHYLEPDDEVGEEAFAVIREAMRAAKVVAISRLVLYRRERAVMLEPRDGGIVLWTLRYGDEVREAADYFDGLDDAKPDAAHLKLAQQVIAKQTRAWSEEIVDDPVQDRLLDIIDAKKKKKTRAKKKAAPKAPPTTNVVNIMDALKASLKNAKQTGAGGKGSEKKSA